MQGKGLLREFVERWDWVERGVLCVVASCKGGEERSCDMHVTFYWPFFDLWHLEILSGSHREWHRGYCLTFCYWAPRKPLLPCYSAM